MRKLSISFIEDEDIFRISEIGHKFVGFSQEYDKIFMITNNCIIVGNCGQEVNCKVEVFVENCW